MYYTMILKYMQVLSIKNADLKNKSAFFDYIYFITEIILPIHLRLCLSVK